MKTPDANKIIELYYFSMFVICMAYYEIKNIKIFYPLVKMNRTVRGLGGRVIWHIVNKYREGNWTAIWHDPLPIGYLKMKEYEKYFQTELIICLIYYMLAICLAVCIIMKKNTLNMKKIMKALV